MQSLHTIRYTLGRETRRMRASSELLTEMNPPAATP